MSLTCLPKLLFSALEAIVFTSQRLVTPNALWCANVYKAGEG